MSETLYFILILLAVGGFAGVLAGLFGVGGGIVLVPAFLWVFERLGYDNSQLMQICVATSLATIVFTSVRSVLAHHKKGAVDWHILRSWALPIALGAVLAVWVARDLRSQVMMLVFAILALIISVVMFFRLGRKALKDHMPGGWVLWIYALPTGFLSTMMGIGGGSIMVPIMVSHGRSIHQAVATAAGFGALIAIPSVLAFMLSKPPVEALPPFQIGYVNLAAFLVVIVATSVTAPLGARLAHRLDAKLLKKFFAVFVFFVALNMLRKALMG